MKTPAPPQPVSLPQQRTAAVCLVLCQSLALGVMMDSPAFAGFAALIACAGLVAQRANWLISLPGDRWGLVLAILFFLKYYFAPREMAFSHAFLLTEFSYEVASFCIVIELLLLFRKENQEKIPIGLLAFSVVGLIFTGNVRLNEARRTVMLAIVQLFFISWAWFAMQSRREVKDVRMPSRRFRLFLMCGVLLIAAFSGTTVSVLLHRHERKLESWLGQLLMINDFGPSRAGFSARGGLSDVSNWRGENSKVIALRAKSDVAPGYLRGKAFDEFNMDRWVSLSQVKSLHPQRSSPEESGVQLTYQLASGQRTPGREVEVWPVDNMTAGHCFTSLNTIELQSRAKNLSMDGNQIITRANEYEIIPYSLFNDVDYRGIPHDNPRQYLQLPLNVDERVKRVAREVFASAETPSQKFEAVEQFFQENFQYQIGLVIPRGEDRLGYFLEHRLPAHCEYFATATAILLRLANVPCRYVTGYVAREKNEIDGMWVARREHAHAWVEAYDSELEQWVIVESTPSAGVPAGVAADRWQQRRESLAHSIRAMAELIKSGSYAAAAWILVQPMLWVGLLGVMAIVIFRWAQKRLWGNRSGNIDKQEVQTALTLERVEMDKLVQKFGVLRETDETTQQFAHRLEEEPELHLGSELAQWYRDYTLLRFRPQTDHLDVDQLQQRRITISRGIKKVRIGGTTSA